MKVVSAVDPANQSGAPKVTGLAAFAINEYLAEDAEIKKLIELASYSGFHDIRKVYLFGTGSTDWSGIPKNGFLGHQRLPGICSLRQHRREVKWTKS